MASKETGRKEVSLLTAVNRSYNIYVFQLISHNNNVLEHVKCVIIVHELLQLSHFPIMLKTHAEHMDEKART